MVELPFDPFKEKRVLETQGVGGRATLELLTGHEQCPSLRECVAMISPGSTHGDT
jgi:hypothetical protein